MRRPRLAFLNAAIEGADTTRNFRRELDADLVEFDATAGDLPDSFAFDGVVVTGSRSSVYDDVAWIDATREWVREAIDRELPCLGVCWGHQLLADALGGTVADMGEYEIGYRTVDRTAASTTGDDPLLAGLDESVTVFTTHSDAVVDLPPDAVELAVNEYGNHGFRAGRVFGVQFHPEYDRATARRVTAGKDDLDDATKQAVYDGITDENYAAACEAKQLFENFTAYVTRIQAAATDGATDRESPADGDGSTDRESPADGDGSTAH